DLNRAIARIWNVETQHGYARRRRTIWAESRSLPRGVSAKESATLPELAILSVLPCRHRLCSHRVHQRNFLKRSALDHCRGRSIELLPPFVIFSPIQNPCRPGCHLHPPFASWFEHLLHDERLALVACLAIAPQHRIDFVTSFEPTVDEDVVGCELETIRQQVFEGVGVNCMTFLNGIEQRRRAHQLRLNRRDTDSFEKTDQSERRHHAGLVPERQ